MFEVRSKYTRMTSLVLEAVAQRCSVKKVFLEISRPATLLKKKLWHRCFPVNYKSTFVYRTTLVAASVVLPK